MVLDEGSTPLPLGRATELQLRAPERGRAPREPGAARSERIQVVVAEQYGRKRVERGRERQRDAEVAGVVQESRQCDLAAGFGVVPEAQAQAGPLRAKRIAAATIARPAGARRIG